MHCTHRGKGHAILFIHGMPTNGTLWSKVIDELCAEHQCFAVDLPGMGKTPFHPYGPDYLDRMAAQIEAVRVRHGVTRWHVVGHDAGSAIAVHYASRFAKHVGCLALLSPAIFPDLKPFFLLNHLRKPVVGEMLAPLVHLAFWKIAMRRALEGSSAEVQLEAFRQPFAGPAGAWRLMRLVRWGKPEEMLRHIPAQLAELPMPTLLFHGAQDVLPPEFAERAASLIRNAHVVTLDAGHFLPLDQPKEVAACFRNFFGQHLSTMKRLSTRRKAGKAKLSTHIERRPLSRAYGGTLV